MGRHCVSPARHFQTREPPESTRNLILKKINKRNNKYCCELCNYCRQGRISKHSRVFERRKCLPGVATLLSSEKKVATPSKQRDDAVHALRLNKRFWRRSTFSDSINQRRIFQVLRLAHRNPSGIDFEKRRSGKLNDTFETGAENSISSCALTSQSRRPCFVYTAKRTEKWNCWIYCVAWTKFDWNGARRWAERRRSRNKSITLHAPSGRRRSLESFWKRLLFTK